MCSEVSPLAGGGRGYNLKKKKKDGQGGNARLLSFGTAIVILRESCHVNFGTEQAKTTGFPSFSRVGPAVFRFSFIVMLLKVSLFGGFQLQLNVEDVDAVFPSQIRV